MWVAYDRSSTIEVRYSDGLYTSFSAPITVASGISSDDIGTIIAMPGGTIGVFWSNQNAKRFGFRTHVDGTDPNVWSADEVPAGQSALSKGGGFADDHLNLAVSANGTLYAAVKTSYDSSGYASIALLVRRPDGIWDNVYDVDTSGTRPVVVNSEAHNQLAVFYTKNTGGGDIVMRASALDQIDLGPRHVVLSGNFNDVTTSKAAVGDEILVLARKSGSAFGSLIQVGVSGVLPNAAPTVNAGADQSITLPGSASLNGSASDDGQPFGTLLTTWTKVSGPGTVTFANANATSTTATFSQAGSYVLRLTANDGSLQGSDDVVIQVNAAPNSDSADGLAGHWTMDGNGNDQSGQGNHGSPVGSTSYVAGRISSALLLSSSSSRLEVPDNNSLDMTGAITISAWIRPQSSGTQYVISKKGKSSIDGYELSLSNKGKVFVRFNEDSSGNSYRVDSSTKYPTNGQTWMHVVATYDGTTIKLYINGELQGSKNASFQIATNDLPLSIGSGQDGYRGMTGAIDDVRIYSRALNDAEVAALAQL